MTLGHPVQIRHPKAHVMDAGTKPANVPLEWTTAAVLALETLVLAAVYARYSLKLAVTNPLVWAVGMGLLAAFVAYGR